MNYRNNGEKTLNPLLLDFIACFPVILSNEWIITRRHLYSLQTDYHERSNFFFQSFIYYTSKNGINVWGMMSFNSIKNFKA